MTSQTDAPIVYQLPSERDRQRMEAITAEDLDLHDDDWEGET